MKENRLYVDIHDANRCFEHAKTQKMLALQKDVSDDERAFFRKEAERFQRRARVILIEKEHAS